MPRARPEHKIQAAIVALWKLRGKAGSLVFAVPNGGLRDPIVGAYLKQEGVLPGVADLAVISPSGKMGWIEVKGPRGRLSDEQKWFGDYVRERGHAFAVVKDLGDAQIVLATWGILRGSGRELVE